MVNTIDMEIKLMVFYKNCSPFYLKSQLSKHSVKTLLAT